VVYYSLELTKIYAALGEQSGLFLQAIRNSVGDKIKYRQQTYAAAIQLENQQHLNFYDPPRPTPRHQRIRKINSHLTKQAHSQIAFPVTPNTPSTPTPPSTATFTPILPINP
jgi:hypothetical protein